MYIIIRQTVKDVYMLRHVKILQVIWIWYVYAANIVIGAVRNALQKYNILKSFQNSAVMAIFRWGAKNLKWVLLRCKVTYMYTVIGQTIKNMYILKHVKIIPMTWIYIHMQ
jgi:hypothetical protein